jgi:hypothetical protein
MGLPSADNMMKTLETERLLLRPFTDNDIEIHRVVFSDPEVCHFYCGKTRTQQETREWLIHRRWQVRSEAVFCTALKGRSGVAKSAFADSGYDNASPRRRAWQLQTGALAPCKQVCVIRARTQSYPSDRKL